VPAAWKTASKEAAKVRSAVAEQELDVLEPLAETHGEVAGVTGKTSGPAPTREQPCQRGEPRPVRWLVPDPAGVPAQHRVLVPQHQQLSILRQVPADRQDSQAEYPANQQVEDLEQHPAGQPPPGPAAGEGAAQPRNRLFERHRFA
jgi:hypothetical protein